MILQITPASSSTAIYARKQCCGFVDSLSPHQFTALFYLDRQFLDWILDHAVSVNVCEKCARTINNCHALMADADFRAEAEKHLITGRRLFISFLQSISRTA